MGLTPSPHAPDDLHWTEGDIESIDVDGRSVSVVARKVFVLGELGPRRIRVTFLGASSATLKVTEYMEPPQGRNTSKRLIASTVEIYKAKRWRNANSVRSQQDGLKVNGCGSIEGRPSTHRTAQERQPRTRIASFARL